MPSCTMGKEFKLLVNTSRAHLIPRKTQAFQSSKAKSVELHLMPLVIFTLRQCNTFYLKGTEFLAIEWLKVAIVTLYSSHREFQLVHCVLLFSLNKERLPLMLLLSPVFLCKLGH